MMKFLPRSHGPGSEGVRTRLDAPDKSTGEKSYEFASISEVATPVVDSPRRAVTKERRRSLTFGIKSLSSRDLMGSKSNLDYQPQQEESASPDTVSTRSSQTLNCEEREASQEENERNRAKPVEEAAAERGATRPQLGGRGLLQKVKSFRKNKTISKEPATEKQKQGSVKESPRGSQQGGRRGGLQRMFSARRAKKDGGAWTKQHIGEIKVTQKHIGEIQITKKAPPSDNSKSHVGEIMKPRVAEEPKPLRAPSRRLEVSALPSFGEQEEERPEEEGLAIPNATIEADEDEQDSKSSPRNRMLMEESSPKPTRETLKSSSLRGSSASNGAVSPRHRTTSMSDHDIRISSPRARSKATRSSSAPGIADFEKSAHSARSHSMSEESFADFDNSPDLAEDDDEESDIYYFPQERDLPHVYRQSTDSFSHQNVIFQFFVDKENPVIWVVAEEEEGTSKFLELNIIFAAKVAQPKARFPSYRVGGFGSRGTSAAA
jgi:hypothetical protein